jgi:hypothetical protein
VTERGKAAARRWARGALAALALTATLAATASAHGGDVKVTVDVRPGHLTLGASTDVSSAAERSRGLHRILVTITDARGSGAGWRLDLRASTGGAAIVAVDTRCGQKSTCTLPQSPTGIPMALGAGHRTTVLDAPKGTGMGRIDVALTVATSTTSGSQALSCSLQPG